MKYIFSVIYQFLDENYFSSSLKGQYDYLDFTGINTTLLFLVGGLLLGIVIASFMAYYQKTVVGRFVRRLLAGKVYTPDLAVTLEENERAVKRELCSRASVLRKLISCVEDGTVYDYRSELAARLGVSDKETEEKEEKTPDAAKAEANQEAAPVQEAEGGEEKSSRPFGARLFGKEPALSVRRPDFSKARFFIPEELSYRAEMRYGARGASARSLILTTAVCVVLFFLALTFIPVFVNMLDVSIGNVIGGL
ncbi:MAG: hypothetical protein J6W28_05490 [Clostridia bacterium]|nr:hypothetical protein [Clostridia bacterium]